jgi:hypothetical protein
MPGLQIWQRSPVTADGVPNRARAHTLESAKRLLRCPADDMGAAFRERGNSVSIDAGCRRFRAILPNSSGFVRG